MWIWTALGHRRSGTWPPSIRCSPSTRRNNSLCSLTGSPSDIRPRGRIACSARPATPCAPGSCWVSAPDSRCCKVRLFGGSPAVPTLTCPSQAGTSAPTSSSWDDQNSSLEFLSALFFAFLFNQTRAIRRQHPEQRCKIPVNIILDEMNNIGSIKDFGRRLSNNQVENVANFDVFSKLASAQNRYPNNLWAELLGNADTQILLGATDDVTAEYFQRPQRGHDGGGKLHYDHPAEASLWRRSSRNTAIPRASGDGGY